MIVRGDGHDRAGAVAHQDVVRDPDRGRLPCERVDGRESRREAFLLRLHGESVLDPLAAQALDERGSLTGQLAPVVELLDERVLRGEHYERRPVERVGPRGEDLDRLLRAAHLEANRGALAPADPVRLHHADLLGPVRQPFQIPEQRLGVGCDLEEPLLQLALLDHVA